MGTALEAWAAAPFFGSPPAPDRTGVVAGSSRSAAWAPTGGSSRLHELVMTTGSALAGALARRLKISGPHLLVSSACTSSASAIALAADLIRSGAIDAALAGGVDLGAHPATRRVFAANGLCAADSGADGEGCLPFDRRSRGIRLGDGAGFAVLIRSSVLPRRPEPAVELAGWARGTDPADRCGLSSPLTILPRVLREAAAMAGITPDDLAFVHAHGNGNPRGDQAEAATLDAFAAARRSPLPVVLTKHLTGHCLGATPAMELAFDTEILARGILPPNSHLTDPLPAPHLELVRERPRPCPAPCSCLVSFGLWGSCAALVLRRHGPPAG